MCVCVIKDKQHPVFTWEVTLVLCQVFVNFMSRVGFLHSLYPFTPYLFATHRYMAEQTLHQGLLEHPAGAISLCSVLLRLLPTSWAETIIIISSKFQTYYYLDHIAMATLLINGRIYPWGTGSGSSLKRPLWLAHFDGVAMAMHLEFRGEIWEWYTHLVIAVQFDVQPWRDRP